MVIPGLRKARLDMNLEEYITRPFGLRCLGRGLAERELVIERCASMREIGLVQSFGVNFGKRKRLR